MRTHSGPQRTLLASGEYDFHEFVYVQKPDGSWQDMGNFANLDWVDNARWNDGIDPPTMEGSTSFVRAHQDTTLLSLAPYMQSSQLNNDSFLYAPALKGSRGLKVYIAYTAKGVAPVPTDLIEVFNGYINNPSWGGEEPLVECAMRDIGGYLMSQWIEDEETYSTSLGMPLEDVLQAILNAHPNIKLGIVDLYTPVSPATNRTTVKISPKPVLLALRDLAAEIGWDVKFRYDSAGQFRLTFFQLDRSKVIPDYTIGSDEYIDIQSMEWPTDDIRNRVQVVGYDAVTGARLSAIADDEASQLEYGTHFMKLVDEASQNLTTQAGLDNLAAIVLSDLSRPFATQRLLTPFFWIAQTGDLIGVGPNGVQHDTQLNLAVMSMDYAIGGGDGDTVLQLREQVAGFVGNWLLKEDPGGPAPEIAPTISARFTIDTDWLGYVYLTPSSPTGEQLGINYLDNGDWGLPAGTEMYLCISNVNPAKRWVPSDVEIDPYTAYFTDGTTIIGPMATVTLVPGKTLIWMFQAVGQTSGLKSDWLSVGLSFSKPLLQAADIAFYESDPTNPASAQLNFSVQSRQLTGSIRVDLNTVDVWTGGPYLTTRYYNLPPGQTVTDLYTSIALVRQAPYFLRAIPFAGPLVAGVPTGVQGDTVYASTFAPFRAAPQVQVDAVTTDVAAVNSSQVLVSTAPSGSFPNARTVANSTSVALDTSVAGAAQFYVPNLGIDTAKLGTGAVTDVKVTDVGTGKLRAPGGTTPGYVLTVDADGTSIIPAASTGGSSTTITEIVAALGQISIPTVFFASGSGYEEFATIPAASTEISAALRRRRQLDGAAQYRVNCNVIAASAGTSLTVKYSGDGFGSSADLTPLLLTGTGDLTTGWIDCPTGIQTDPVELSPFFSGGAGTDTVKIAAMDIEFRQALITAVRDFSDDFSDDFS